MSGHRLRVAVLGTLRAWLDDRELTLGPARQRAVFAALATRAATRPATRGELIQAVWGETAPASADGSVHTYISGLRRVLEPGRARWSTDGLLLSDATGYRLRLDGDALDARLFGRLHEEARSRWLAGDADGTVEVLDRALALWSGEALSGVPGPHAEALRTSLTRQRVLAQELRAEALLGRGGHEDLVPELTVLVREHPLREPLWRLLMTALHRGGRTTEALDTFRTARETLRRELGVPPGPELTETHRRILTDDPAVAPPAPAEPLHRVLPGQVAHALAHRGDRAAGCRGRAPEIARLRQLADDVVAGHGRTVWIEGEPGIGKTELLTTALGDVAERGCHVAWAAASELGQSVPLQVLTEGLGLGAGEPAAGAEQVLAHVERLCATAPLVLVVDDLQWADEASVLLWNRLSAAAHRLPLLLVATSRPAGRREDLARARRAAELRGLEALTLGPLAPADAGGLIEDLVGGRPGARLGSLVGKAAGNPLYLREVTTALVREGAVELEDGVAELREGTALTVPGSLLGAVDRTLAQLDGFTREAVRRAAMLGMEFGLAQVAATMGVLPSALLGAFGAVMDLGIVVDARTQLAFRHPLLRWALYHEIPAADRAAWHRRAAEALADTGAGVEHVAQQLVAVPAKVDDWVTGWLAEHHAALAARAPSVAAVLLRRVLDECGPADPRREVLLAANVRVLFALDQEPLDAAEEAMTLSRDPARAAEMRHIAAVLTHRRGDTRAALALLEGNDAPGTPPLWRERRRSLPAPLGRGRLDDPGRAARQARRTRRTAPPADGPDPIGGPGTLWLIKPIERDHGAALRYVEHAALIRHGIAGVVHGRRGDAERAAAHVHGTGEHVLVIDPQRAAGDFLLVVRSPRAEQQGDPERAADVLAPLTKPGCAPMVLRHQWLPRLVGPAREHGRDEVTAEAPAVCREEAAGEVLPAWAGAAARWCAAFATGDPEPRLRAITYHGEVGGTVERATALGDAAVLLAVAGRPVDAGKAADEAVGEPAAPGAAWDVRWIGVRLREFGIDATAADPAAGRPASS